MSTNGFQTAAECVAFWHARQDAFPTHRRLLGPLLYAALADQDRQQIVAYEATHVGERLWCVGRWTNAGLRDLAFLEAGLYEALTDVTGNPVVQQVIDLAIMDGHWRHEDLPAQWRNPLSGQVIEPRCRRCLKTFAKHDPRQSHDLPCAGFQPDPRTSLPEFPKFQRWHGSDTTFAYYDVQEANALIGQLYEFWLRRGDVPIAAFTAPDGLA